MKRLPILFHLFGWSARPRQSLGSISTRALEGLLKTETSILLKNLVDLIRFSLLLGLAHAFAADCVAEIRLSRKDAKQP